ncbi:PQQ-binding-like beta-propeller repeat protein [Parendozoicomonas haliclonae]|uniref:PQQ enzyme repeat protein n=1 Tax=Parendozoicomonas haliclonae TaxID=1960125 RepID=A0A1X7ARW8_9GAMM|nr:PQQ-binding-like beta-propeller repeat protein [Parendozoicomonas haliclonae]SMA50830.1 PQQ enzyme repeat protein [Parendozoicomonas haliclonae]
MAKKRWIAGTVAVAATAVGIGLNSYLKTPKTYKHPAVSQWQPEGTRFSPPEHPVLGINDTFRSIHGSTRNSDEVLTAVSPAVELDWIAEPEMFTAEGPSIDRQGNIYFSPLTPMEPVVMVSLDPKNGERRWAIEGKPYSQGGGTPLVLDDPDNPGQQIIYLTLYERALAVRQDGSIIWDVSTGLKEPKPKPGKSRNAHNFGASYHPQSDSIFGLLIDGNMFALDRKTGERRLVEPFVVPGAPAIGSGTGRPAPWLIEKTDQTMKEAYGEDPQAPGRFSKVADVIYGGGVKVANYFSIDPNTGRIWVAATAPDEADAVEDGKAGNGALYAIDMVEAADGRYRLEVAASTYFEGGSGSTPALRADGQRVYASDDNGHLIALDNDLNELWRVNVGEQIPASITVASENNELFAITTGSLFKIKDHGKRGEIVWEANLDMYPEMLGYRNLNMLTATVTANGIAVMLGSGYEKGTVRLPIEIGVGLLDRETGEVISYTEGVEESVAATITGPDGGYYIAHSPIRRSISRALFGPLVSPLTGGIARYKPVRNHLLMRDTLCAADKRLSNALAQASSAPASSQANVVHADVLLRQANIALTAATQEGILDKQQLSGLSDQLTDIDTTALQQASTSTASLCEQLTTIATKS